VELILNWLWQGGVVALAAAGVLGLISPARTLARYAVAWAACAAVLALPVVPLVGAASPEAGVVDPARGTPILSVPAGWWTSTALALTGWALWVAVQGVRVTVATAALRRAKEECRAFPSQREARLAHWTRLSATGRGARLVLSDRVSAAAVLGGTSPLIAVAPPLLDLLGDADLDRIVVHEWAHVQRRDDVAQAVQLLVGMVAGWHPAMWWLNRQLHLEREVACDEAAVAATGSAKDYAACLATLASLPNVAVRGLPAMAAAPSGLRRRIVRILTTRQASAPTRRATAVMAGISVGVVAVGVGNLRLVDIALSSSMVLGGLAVDMASLVAAPDVLASGAVPRPLPADRATPLRVRARVRAGRTDGRTAARATEAVAGPVLEPGTATVATTTLPSANQPVPVVTFAPASSPAALGLPGAASRGPAPAPGRSPSAGDDARAIWGAAVDSGKAIGRRSGDAATATAGFFTRFGRKVAASF
jgi:beta-lactamase regulating signal transducer with metallopeptidase domain